MVTWRWGLDLLHNILSLLGLNITNVVVSPYNHIMVNYKVIQKIFQDILKVLTHKKTSGLCRKFSDFSLNSHKESVYLIFIIALLLLHHGPVALQNILSLHI